MLETTLAIQKALKTGSRSGFHADGRVVGSDAMGLKTVSRREGLKEPPTLIYSNIPIPEGKQYGGSGGAQRMPASLSRRLAVIDTIALSWYTSSSASNNRFYTKEELL
jgi:hypothetical protein